MSTTSQGQTTGIDPALISAINLSEMVDRAIASPDLAPLFQDSGLTNAQVLEEVLLKLPDYLAVAAEGVAAMQKADAEYKSLSDRRDNENAQLPQEPSRPQLVLAIFAVALSLTALAIADVKGDAVRSLSASSYLPLVVIGALAIFALLAWGFIAAIRWFPGRRRYLDAFGKITPLKSVAALQTQARQLRVQL